MIIDPHQRSEKGTDEKKDIVHKWKQITRICLASHYGAENYCNVYCNECTDLVHIPDQLKYEDHSVIFHKYFW